MRHVTLVPIRCLAIDLPADLHAEPYQERLVPRRQSSRLCALGSCGSGRARRVPVMRIQLLCSQTTLI